MIVHGGAVGQLLHLSDGGLRDLGVAVPDADAEVLAEEINVLFPGIVPDVLHRALGDDKRLVKGLERAERRREIVVAIVDDRAVLRSWRRSRRGAGKVGS